MKGRLRKASRQEEGDGCTKEFTWYLYRFKKYSMNPKDAGYISDEEQGLPNVRGKASC